MIIDKDFSKELALKLLEINAVVLRPHEPFTWSSGWSSPIYCDNRLTLRYPELRSKISGFFCDYINKKFPDVDVISGTATAGIPHAAWVADRLNKPMAYVRGKPKQHGKANQIEGGVRKDESTILIEDLISTGESVISAAEVMKFVGVNVLGSVSIFHYGFDTAKEKFERAGLSVGYLTDYETLIQTGVKFGFVDQRDLELLNQWRLEPDTWPRS